MKDFRFSVKNMDCASCVNVILRKLKAMEGVIDVTIDPESRIVKVTWDSPNTCEEDLTCTVEQLGYKVSAA